MTRRLYLAGPEVFLENALEIGAAKRAICARFGVEGVFPLDAGLDLAGLSPRDAGLAIGRANEDLMRSCDALIANMTPFRGPGMDGGTAYEMGFMRALGRPVFGYTAAAGAYVERAGGVRTDGQGRLRDARGWIVEDFGMADNLMMTGAVIASGTEVAVLPSAPSGDIADLAAFERCLEGMAAQFAGI